MTSRRSATARSDRHDRRIDGELLLLLGRHVVKAGSALLANSEVVGRRERRRREDDREEVVQSSRGDHADGVNRDVDIGRLDGNAELRVDGADEAGKARSAEERKADVSSASPTKTKTANRRKGRDSHATDERKHSAPIPATGVPVHAALLHEQVGHGDSAMVHKHVLGHDYATERSEEHSVASQE